MRLALTPLTIPFKVAFRHASASRAETSSVWVEARTDSGLVGVGESCPRPYVTGESLDTVQAFFERHRAELSAGITSLEGLRAWTSAHEPEIDRNPAAWCAIELALLDLLARQRGETVEALLGLRPLDGEFDYTAVVGDAGPEAFRAMAGQYFSRGFRDFKIKLSGDPARDAEKAAVLRALHEQHAIRVRADANNLWTSRQDALAALRALDYPLFAVEEPIGANDYENLNWIGAALGCRVVLDESLLRARQVEAVPGAADRWIVNVRVSKMGGLLRSLAVVEASRQRGIGVIVGAQVGETSLLTRAGLTVAHASRDCLVAQEGAFGTLLLERDVCDPPLMFGAGGVLDVARFPFLTTPGLGIGPNRWRAVRPPFSR
jgi:L-alanine-DL-glutamate epimerase-like enolase superfamily enzyme